MQLNKPVIKSEPKTCARKCKRKAQRATEGGHRESDAAKPPGMSATSSAKATIVAATTVISTTSRDVPLKISKLRSISFTYLSNVKLVAKILKVIYT